MRASGVGRSASPRPRMARYSFPRTETARSGASQAKAALWFNDDGESRFRARVMAIGNFGSLTFGALDPVVIKMILGAERPRVQASGARLFLSGRRCESPTIGPGQKLSSARVEP